MDWSAVVDGARLLEALGARELLDEPLDDVAATLPGRVGQLLLDLGGALGARTLGELVDAPRSAHALVAIASASRRQALVAYLVEILDLERSPFEDSTPPPRDAAIPSKARPPAAAAASIDEVPTDRRAVCAWAERSGVRQLLDRPLYEVQSRHAEAAHSMLVEDVFLPARFPPRPKGRPADPGRQAAILNDARRWLLAHAVHARKERAILDAFHARRRRPAFETLRPAVEALEELRARFERMPQFDGGVGPRYPLVPVGFRERPAALLVRIPGTYEPYELWLRGDRPDGTTRGGGYSLGARGGYVAMVAALDALCDPEGEAARALDAYLATPSWVRALREVARRSAAPQLEERPGRLAFRVVGSGSGTQIETLLQSPRARGGDFTPGKVVEAYRIREQISPSALDARLLDELIALRAEGGMRREAHARRLAALLGALADHPRVTMAAPGGPAPATIRRGRLALALIAAPDEREPGHRVSLSLGGVARTPEAIQAATLADGSVILADGDARTYWLGHLDPSTSALVSALAEFPATFPPEGLEPLLDLLSRGEVEADLLLPDEVLGETLEADPRPVAQLAPLGAEALAVTIGVRPLPGARLCEPGVGSERVLGARDGARVSARRRFDEERARAERLLAALPFDEAEREGAFTLRVADPDRAANLLVALSELGSEVTVEWPEGPSARIVATASRADLRLRIERKRDWFGVEGEVEIEGHRLALSAMLAAVRAGHRFVRVGTGKLVALGHELRSRLAVADDALFQSARGLEAAPPAFASLADLVEKDEQIRASKEWLALRARLLRARTYEPPPPRLNAELRPYQVDGYRWLARLAEWGAGACLADDMGLGKTLQALALLVHRAERGPALVLAPTSVCSNWLREAERFAPTLRVRSYRGPARRALLDAIGPGDVLVTSYELMRSDAEALAGRRFATLVLDEAQALKNALAKRSAAARELDAEFSVALTGTPIENHLGELWSLFRVVSPGLLGSWDRFRDKFAGPIERDRDPERRDALAALLRPYLLRRTKRAVAPELPARIETHRLITLSPPERALYEAERLLALEALAGALGPGARFAVLAALTRLRQLACHPRMHDPASTIASSKLAAFLELLVELREGDHRCLVFSQFTSHLALVREALDARRVRYLYLDGSTPAEQREGLVRAFQAGEAELFLISLKAGGTGLNLTAADFVVHLDPWWNPAVEDQATDRAHRIGQSKPVTVVRLIAQGTIEESVVSLHAEKRELAEGLLAGGELAGRLSTEDLAALMRTTSAEAAEDEGG